MGCLSSDTNVDIQTDSGTLNSDASASKIKAVLQTSTMDVTDAVQFLPCQDLSEDDSTRLKHTALGMWVGMDSATCQVARGHCGNMTSDGVRALCPETCGCHRPYPARGGFFQ